MVGNEQARIGRRTALLLGAGVSLLGRSGRAEASPGQALSAMPAWEEFSAEDGRTVGAPRRAPGTVVIVELMDYACPACKAAHAAMPGVLRARPRMRLVRRDMPILGQASLTAAAAVAAAALQGREEALHDALMRLREPLRESSIVPAAVRAGIDSVRMSRDMGGREVAARMDGIMRIAKAVGMQGTPTYAAARGARLSGFGYSEIIAFVDGQGANG